MSYEIYKKLSECEILLKLRSSGERTEFIHQADRGDNFEALEDASYALDINFDCDIASKQLSMGNDDLINILYISQVEFCCS